MSLSCFLRVLSSPGASTHKVARPVEVFTHLASLFCARSPIFAPSVGRYYKGMIVEVPLPLAAMGKGAKLEDVHAVLEQTYKGEHFVTVASLAEARALKTLDPEGLNGSNQVKLFVFGHDEEARLVALLDNLGKGASGAAVQNLNIALGLDEGAGLI